VRLHKDIWFYKTFAGSSFQPILKELNIVKLQQSRYKEALMKILPLFHQPEGLT
jgi:hypothetical protein